ncbi:MAG: carboxypeptidase-like regulatory domain-containing protein [Bdellovibrionia bacterium]
MKIFISLGLVASLLTGCSPQQNENKSASDLRNWFPFLNESPKSAEKISIKSLDGKALAGAQILIGTHPGALDNNFFQADENGEFYVPASWQGPETLTVEAPGYMRMTVIAAEPKSQTLSLRKISAAQKVEVKGITTGHNIVDRDGLIDFGLVIPALTKTDLLAFNINSVISTEVDTISVAGQELAIPSNVSLPRQKESYIIPITIEKAQYRVYFDELGAIERVYAAKGRFPFKSVANQMRNGAKFFDVINEFSITGGAIRDIELKSASNRLDIPTTELSFTDKKVVSSPAFAKDELAIAVGISQASGYLIPTDLKRLTANGKMTLNLAPQTESSLLTVIKRTSEMEGTGPGIDRISASLIPFEAGDTRPSHLPLMPNPTVLSPRELSIPTVPTIQGVNPLATYSIISTITEKTVNGTKVIQSQPQWEIYAPKWASEIKLPDWPHNTLTGKKRWQVALIGSTSASEAEMNPNVVKDVTHVTNSSVDF